MEFTETVENLRKRQTAEYNWYKELQTNEQEELHKLASTSARKIYNTQSPMKGPVETFDILYYSALLDLISYRFEDYLIDSMDCSVFCKNPMMTQEWSDAKIARKTSEQLLKKHDLFFTDELQIDERIFQSKPFSSEIERSKFRKSLENIILKKQEVKHNDAIN